MGARPAAEGAIRGVGHKRGGAGGGGWGSAVGDGPHKDGARGGGGGGGEGLLAAAAAAGVANAGAIGGRWRRQRHCGRRNGRRSRWIHKNAAVAHHTAAARNRRHRRGSRPPQFALPLRVPIGQQIEAKDVARRLIIVRNIDKMDKNAGNNNSNKAVEEHKGRAEARCHRHVANVHVKHERDVVEPIVGEQNGAVDAHFVAAAVRRVRHRRVRRGAAAPAAAAAPQHRHELLVAHRQVPHRPLPRGLVHNRDHRDGKVSVERGVPRPPREAWARRGAEGDRIYARAPRV